MKNKIKRIAIFVIYDKQGIVDEYCMYIIRELKSVCDEVVVVCNGKITNKSRVVLQKETSRIFIRENEGYDALAYKYGIETAIGWNVLESYDELLLVNDSFYGPFWSLINIMENMEKRKLDFWGITGQVPMKNTFGCSYPELTLPYHIQTYFLVINARMLHNMAFKQFWNSIRGIEGFTDAVTNFELQFTDYFTKKGFMSGTYVCSMFQEEEKIENRIPYILYNPGELIKKYHCPIVKRKCFTLPYYDILHYSMGQDMNTIFDIIASVSKYNVDMIWKHLIRIMEPGKLHQVLHLRFVLPARSVKKTDSGIDYSKVAVIAHINYPEQQEKCMEYLSHLPKEVDLFITTKSNDIKKNIEKNFLSDKRENVSVLIIGDRGREIRGLLIECKDIFVNYKYICYVHDKRTTGGIADAKVGQLFFDTLWDNMLKSRLYIDNILGLLENNKYIGLLAPPAPYHWNYFRYLGQEWTENYQTTKKLADRLNLSCIMQEEYSPFILGTTFWCRTDVLKPLFEYEFCENDFPEEPLALDGTLNHAIERIFQYATQSQGYASGIVINDEYASSYLQDYHSMIIGVLNEYRETIRFSYLSDYVEMNTPGELVDFCFSFNKIYVYGTGNNAVRMTKWLHGFGMEYQGYIVSDGHRKYIEWNEKPVYVLSEIEDETGEIGIILTLDKRYQPEVLPQLEKKGYRNIYKMRK